MTVQELIDELKANLTKEERKKTLISGFIPIENQRKGIINDIQLDFRFKDNRVYIDVPKYERSF